MPLLVFDDFTYSEEALTEDERALLFAPLQEVEWHASIQGTTVQFSRTGCSFPPHIHEKRDAIGIWSWQSRMKLLRYLNRIDYTKIGPSLFVTLTYPDHIRRNEYKDRSVDRAVFMRYVEKHFGKPVPTIWRIEWEERKSGAYTGKLAPHFHLMLFGVQFLAWQKVRKMWRQTISSGDGALVTHVKRIYNQDGACRYLSKYVSKYRSLDITAYHNSPLKFGRHWGILRKDMIQMAPERVGRVLSRSEIEMVQEYARRRWTSYDASVDGGFTLLGARYANAFAKSLS